MENIHFLSVHYRNILANAQGIIIDRFVDFGVSFAFFFKTRVADVSELGFTVKIIIPSREVAVKSTLVL